MNIIHEYNILSDISTNGENIYQPHYKTWNHKIKHNENEIILHYDAKEKLYIPEHESKHKTEKK